jgi:colicin/pyocin-S2-like DNase family protein
MLSLSDPLWAKPQRRRARTTHLGVQGNNRRAWFDTFDDFRSAFWKAVATVPELAKQFSRTDRNAIPDGLAPRAPRAHRVRGRRLFSLHHNADFRADGLRIPKRKKSPDGPWGPAGDDSIGVRGAGSASTACRPSQRLRRREAHADGRGKPPHDLAAAADLAVFREREQEGLRQLDLALQFDLRAADRNVAYDARRQSGAIGAVDHRRVIHGPALEFATFTAHEPQSAPPRLRDG